MNDVRIEEMASLADALAVARIRNDCREWLTNFTGHISPLTQARWWRRKYSRQAPKNYFVWLARTPDGTPCAYAALAYEPDGGLLTVCVSPEFRRQGLGVDLLNFLRRQDWPPLVPRKLVAVVRNDNERSLNLHMKLGFQFTGNDSPTLMRFELGLDDA
jgi:ribosomal protein S18 acetylase RimI-like enzyme